MPSFPKDNAYRSERWRRAVSELPCVVCFKDGPSQAAHPNHRLKGMGLKAPDCWCVPMCPGCHSEFDQGRQWGKEEKRAMFDEWLILTIHDLCNRGAVRA